MNVCLVDVVVLDHLIYPHLIQVMLQVCIICFIDVIILVHLIYLHLIQVILEIYIVYLKIY